MEKRVKPVPKKKKTGGKRTLRIMLYASIPIFCLMFFIVGLSIGFVYIGHQSGSEVLKWSTWKHLFDLVFAP